MKIIGLILIVLMVVGCASMNEVWESMYISDDGLAKLQRYQQTANYHTYGHYPRVVVQQSPFTFIPPARGRK